MTHIRGCEEVLRLGSEIRNVTDSIIEALEYVNAVSMVCVPCATMPSIDAAMLDSATNTAKEIETIAMRASDIVSDVFSETGRVMHGGVLTPPTTLPAGVSEMSALVDRAGVLQATLRTTVERIEQNLFLKTPLDIDACVM